MSDEIKKSKRRPGRDAQAEESVQHETSSPSEPSPEESHDPETEKVRLEFYGSELLRDRAPKAFQILDSVATDWKNDGDFKALPVGHPVLQIVAAEGLSRAKKIEKTLEEKGVLPILRIGIDFAKSKLNKK
jgi:hypothetical protein